MLYIKIWHSKISKSYFLIDSVDPDQNEQSVLGLLLLSMQRGIFSAVGENSKEMQ